MSDSNQSTQRFSASEAIRSKVSKRTAFPIATPVEPRTEGLDQEPLVPNTDTNRAVINSQERENSQAATSYVAQNIDLPKQKKIKEIKQDKNLEEFDEIPDEVDLARATTIRLDKVTNESLRSTCSSREFTKDTLFEALYWEAKKDPATWQKVQAEARRRTGLRKDIGRLRAAEATLDTVKSRRGRLRKESL